MRTGGPNGRRPRGRHHGGSNGGNGGNGGGHGGHSGHSSGGGSSNQGGNRPRSAASLKHHSFDSNCGDLRVRGNAWQVHEKYQALARDAVSSGDRVAAENFQQHAEHYFRIIEAINEATAQEQRPREGAAPAYGQQPEIPANYYNANSAQPAAQPRSPEGERNGNTTDQQPVAAAPEQQAEATVQHRHPPSPFFTQEEIEEHNGEHTLATAR